MQNQCILGADFLKANGMVVDIGHERLSWASGQVSLLIEAAAPTVNKLSVLLEKYSEVFGNGPDDPLDRTCAVEHSTPDELNNDLIGFPSIYAKWWASK